MHQMMAGSPVLKGLENIGFSLSGPFLITTVGTLPLFVSLFGCYSHGPAIGLG